MERRIEARIDINKQATVTVLGETDRPPFWAKAVEVSRKGISILSPIPLPYLAAVKVELGDLLLLGEVIRIQAFDGGVILAVQLLHSLDCVGDLRRLNRALRWEDRTAEQMEESCLRDAV